MEDQQAIQAGTAIRAAYRPPLQMPCDSPQWRLTSATERQAMSMAELQTYRQRRLCELNCARARITEIRMPAALDVEQAAGELNQTKQLIERIDMDIYRTDEEIKSRPANEGSDDDAIVDGDIVIDEAPPDPQDVQ